jgi:hypothetical protein
MDVDMDMYRTLEKIRLDKLRIDPERQFPYVWVPKEEIKTGDKVYYWSSREGVVTLNMSQEALDVIRVDGRLSMVMTEAGPVPASKISAVCRFRSPCASAK